MIIDDSFEIDAPPDRVWPVLCDVPRVATCFPNAELTEIVDGKTYKANVSVKVGPVALRYGAVIVIESLDDTTYTATVSVHGTQLRGAGGVAGSLISRAIAVGGKTRIDVHADAQISGIIAGLGSHLIEGIAKKTVAQFAENFAKIV